MRSSSRSGRQPSGSTGRLSNGDVIPLSRSGRNPEVEEVLGALSLLLNGGGVAQLKTISTELNKALGGRETDVRSLLSQLKTFMGQLDTNKDQIVRAIESLNRLAIALNKQKPSIKLALDRLPRAVASINRQRDDLVKMLRALANLSSIGTKVIGQSKTATIDSLKALAPTLTKLSEAGDAFPKALQVFLTYPFVDAVVGKNPAVARNLHMGDYTNLSIQLDLNLQGLNAVCSTVPQLQELPMNLQQPPVGEVRRQPAQDRPEPVRWRHAGSSPRKSAGCAGAVKSTLCQAANGLPNVGPGTSASCATFRRERAEGPRSCRSRCRRSASCRSAWRPGIRWARSATRSTRCCSRNGAPTPRNGTSRRATGRTRASSTAT